MKKARISIIAAIGKNRELGKKNELIWRISPDLQRFKRLTVGHPIIMGRKTYESIGRPLPDRINIIVTRGDMAIPGCIVAHSLEEALEIAKEHTDEEIFVIGGAQLYTEALPYADRLYLTIINATDGEADAFFPDYSSFTKSTVEASHPEHTPPYDWITLEH